MPWNKDFALFSEATIPRPVRLQECPAVRCSAFPGDRSADSRCRPAGAPKGDRAVAWVVGVIGGTPESRADGSALFLDPHQSVDVPESFHPVRKGIGTCSFGEHGPDRVSFQIRLFVAVRGPESFLGRNCSYGARPRRGRISPATCQRRYF